MIPVIAVALTEFLKERKNNILQFILTLLCIAAVAVLGKWHLSQAGNYKLVHNYQQVPDEVAAVCEMMKSRCQRRSSILWRR